MTKKEVFDQYNELIEAGEEVQEIILEIHMPTEETETICNPNVKAKMEYIDKTYDENLVHSGCKQIYITDVTFVTPAEAEELPFGAALYKLKHGRKMARAGWNGAGQFVYYVPENSYSPCTEIAKSLVNEKGKVDYNPYFALRTVTGRVSTWVPSVTDLIAEDWYEVK